MGIFLIFRNDAGLTMYLFSAKVRLRMTMGDVRNKGGHMSVMAFVHKKEDASDTELATAAREHFSSNRAKQVIAKLIVLMRAAQLPSMSDKDMHNRFPPTERMKWLEQRPDLRCKVVMDLVRLREHMARKRNLTKQAEDIEEALVEDITYKEYEEAFQVEDLATYGDGDAYVRFFVEGFDWTKGDEKSRALIGVLCNEFLTAPAQLKPPLTHLQVRRAISSVAWQTHVPTDLRAKVDDARLVKQEQSPREPFMAKDEMEIVTTVLLAKHLPLVEMRPVFLAAMKALGFEVPVPKPEDTQPSAANADDKKPDVPTMAPSDSVATSGGPLVLDLDEQEALEAAVTMMEGTDADDAESDGTKVFARPSSSNTDSLGFDAASARSPASTGAEADGYRSSNGNIKLADLKPASENPPTPPPRQSQSGLLDGAPSSKREPPKVVIAPPLRGGRYAKP